MWSVFFVFLSYLDRNMVKGALDAEKESKDMFSMLDGTFCAKMSILGETVLYQVSDGAEVVRSAVSPAGRLLNCSITANQRRVRTFLQECRLEMKGQGAREEMDARFTHMDEAKSMCRELTERTGRRGGEDKTLKRSKRGFTYPGTLWCGAGNMADHYDQLGQFTDTDSCCRTHDHCPHVIHAFSSNYGFTNFRWHSICHCDCDNALKACLRKVNDTSSRVVGQAFFNVIGVPCFDFIYEEQCAERHWYGQCKRLEKFPIAVLREAVPYDFGGIAVIDELTVAPPQTETSKKNNKEEKPEGPTQSTISSPEEPSLRNVVTAAEDFIKVLATVSTSQSSNAESDKDEAQSTEKKKRKNTGKKKKITKKPKGKGKGRKRKQKAEAGVKLEESAAVSPSGSKAEDVKPLSNFISESHKHDKSSRNTNRVGDSEYELEGKDEPSNEVMKDEPVMDEEIVSTTSPMTIQKSPAELASEVTTEEIALSTSTTTVIPYEAKPRRERKSNRKKSKKIPLPSSEEVVVNTTSDLTAVSVPTVITINSTAQPQQQSFTEKRAIVSSASTPTVIPKVKRNRSKERGDKEARKQRRKTSSGSSIVPVAQQNSSVDNLEVIPLTGAPTIPSVPTTEQQLSRRPAAYGGKIQFTALNSPFSALKRKRSKEKGLRNRRRKTLVPPSTENPRVTYYSSENVLPVLQTPDSHVALNLHESTTAMQETETHHGRRLFTTATPTISTKRHQQTARHWRKPRKKAAATLGDAASAPKQTEPMTFTTTPFNIVTAEELRFEKLHMTTSAVNAMSPLQLSVERVKGQLIRKKRRKAALIKR